MDKEKRTLAVAPDTQFFGFKVIIEGEQAVGIQETRFDVGITLNPQAFGPDIDEEMIEQINDFRAQAKYFLKMFFGDVGPTTVITAEEEMIDELTEQIISRQRQRDELEEEIKALKGQREILKNAVKEHI